MKIPVASVFAALVGLTFIPFATLGAESDPFDGTWILQTARASNRSNFTETVTVSHKNGMEEYKAVVMNNGKPSGMRYQASADGKPFPYFDVVTGKKRGTMHLTQKDPWMEVGTFVEDDATVRGWPATAEHWLSNDGRSFISILKNKDGVTTSVLIFERQ